MVRPSSRASSSLAGESHGPEKMVGDDRDIVRVDEDLEPFHEPARRLEPFRDRLDVLEHHLSIDARRATVSSECGSPSASRGIMWRIRRSCSAAVIVGSAWWASVARTSPVYSSTTSLGATGTRSRRRRAASGRTRRRGERGSGAGRDGPRPARRAGTPRPRHRCGPGRRPSRPPRHRRRAPRPAGSGRAPAGRNCSGIS